MEVDLSSGRPAVLVTDVQKLFAAPDGPFENVRSDALVAAINELLDAARKLQIAVIHAPYLLRSDGSDAGLLAGMPGLDLEMMSPGSPWTEIDDRVNTAASDLRCVHNRPSAFYASELDGVLADLGADRLVLAGLSLNNAIAATARDAFARDIPTVIPREAVDAAPFESEDDIDAGFKALDQWTAEVAGLPSVIDRLAARDRSS